MKPRSRLDHNARVEALTRLALATRANVTERATFDVYLESLDDWSSPVLLEACFRMQKTATWFPKVAEIIEVCRAVAREREMREDAKRLKPADFVPVPPERIEEFKAKIRQAIGRHDLAQPRGESEPT